MRRELHPPRAADGTAARPGGTGLRARLRGAGVRRGILSAAVVALLAAATATVVTVAGLPASAADSPNPYQRGPDPTVASVAATNGPFATAQLTVPAGNGFNGGYIYYPTDTSQGTWGAVAIVPGYTALFANEEAWMGPRLASFGFVVIGIETNSRTDYDTQRGTQLLAALDYLTQKSAVRDRVDPTRLAVIGHSMGGGGALYAATQRPSLKAAIGLAPYKPSGDLSADRVPTLIQGGQNDTTVTPSYLNGLYPTLPASTPGAFVQLAGAGHLFWTSPNSIELRTQIPWLKVFVDNDTRYTQFLCPTAKDGTGISSYSATCSLIPTPTTPPTSPPPTTPPTSPPPTSPPPTSPPPTSPPVTGGCAAAYRTVSSWPGGFQGEVTVTAGNAAIRGWTVRWTPAAGQTVGQVWNGTLSTGGSAVSVTNASYNGALQPSASTTFGFLSSGTASSPALTCTSS